MERITSKENARIKLAARLMSDKSERCEARLFVAEGARLCAEAAQNGVEIMEAYVTTQAASKYPEASVVLEAARDAFEITDAVANRLSGTKTPQGIFAVCRMPEWEKPAEFPKGARYLLLSSLRDPGNVGTIIRTADALGLDGVVLSSDCPDIYAAKTLRATMGGAFRVKTWVIADIPAEIARMREKGVAVYAADMRGPSVSDIFPIDGACAVVLGNEGAGLEADVLAACGGAVCIPMAGRAESLCVAAAAGILAWEMTK